ncbi:MAG: hypothetical protein ACI35O_01175 [Bacillaceae bacterium]
MSKTFHYIAMIDAYPLVELGEEIEKQLAGLLWSTNFHAEGEDTIYTHMYAVAQQLNATAIEKLEVLFTENKAHVGLVGFVMKNEDGTTIDLMEEAVNRLEISKKKIIAVKKGEEQVQIYLDKQDGYESFYGDEQFTYEEMEKEELFGSYEVYWYQVKQ